MIVNADDFGLSPGVTRGILRAHRRGIVTSTSLMVRGVHAAAAAARARDAPTLDVGLHLDLAEWRFSGGSWVANYVRIDLDDANAVRDEVVAQVGLFRELVGRDPTH